MGEGYTIGQVASCSGVTIDTIRVYERQGLIEVPKRRPNGYRHYPKKSIRRINFIKWTQSLGFTLKEIKEILAISPPSTRACEEIRHRLEFKLNCVERELKKLLCLKDVLESVIQTCSMTLGEHCPVLEALEQIDLEDLPITR
ncbi:MAG: heavy metal-responsive transcriptional regulator [Alphaproteobacteria bacterium]|jgi:DNA-binding transcriptional MerR regulator|nr:heavy metal-responsive transcriptional regulator [Alphaproteobacteria bacterium]